MRGSTYKKLRKFAQMLIDNTTQEDLKGKDKHQIVNELKVHWNTKGKPGQSFIRKALKNGFAE